jgi:thiamine phosphate synthase YjbQ (UPF0047 family)
METATFEVRTGTSPVVRDITEQVAGFARAAGGDGLLHVFVPHATAGLAILETGSGSDHDLLAALDALLPGDDRWRHAHGSVGHGRSHVMPALVLPGRPQRRQRRAVGPRIAAARLTRRRF